ncbi:MAG: energy-coupled thiamine transporter ThiT [Firmicutes bacterium]|nr:energy-coupled thiamine transporter ThiT [Bacillota bacterium]
MKKTVSMIAEGGVCVALAIALSFVKIPIGVNFGGFGGSIDLVMVPLVVFALRWGAGWGMLAGLVFGTIKFFLGGSAIDIVSIIFDYSVAYAFVGLAGLFRKAKGAGRPIGAFFGCLGRFAIHFISGFTVYARWMPKEFMGMAMTSKYVYSLLYNGTYMLPNTILCVLVIALLAKPMDKLEERRSS